MPRTATAPAAPAPPQNRAERRHPEAIVRRLYPVPEVALALGVTDKHVWSLVYGGQLGSVKLGRRRLVPAEALDAFIAGLVDNAAS